MNSTQLTANRVAFLKGKINAKYIPVGEQSSQMAMTLQAELMNLGFMFSQSAFNMLMNASEKFIKDYYNEIIPFAKNIVGANYNYRPFWPGFPQQVVEKSESELWMYQLMHYWSNGHFVPDEWTGERKSAFEKPNYIIINLCTDAEYQAIFTNLVSANQSLTDSDKQIIQFFVESGNYVLPSEIPFKETLCYLASMYVPVPVRSVTDVLRIAVGLSGGDVSLPKVPAKYKKVRWGNPVLNNCREPFKFKKFNRAERKYLLNLLNNSNLDASEGVLKDNRWVRLGEILHPGEYRKQFPKVFDFFQKVRNGEVRSWHSAVDAAFKISFEDGLVKLSERPGEFARKLDALIRKNPEKVSDIFSAFVKVGDRVSNKVLYELYAHFSGRDVVESRSIMIKGSRKRTQLSQLEPLDAKLVNNILTFICNILMNKFAHLPKLGKVWIDPELANLPMPTNMRSMNASMRPMLRGQRVKVSNDKAKVIRAFVHWFDENGDQDVDLSASFFNSKGQIVHEIAFNRNHNSSYGCHSGDVRHRQGACAEYVDINVDYCQSNGIKYVVIEAMSYDNIPFSKIEESYAGFMDREFPESNMTFIPSTLQNCVKLTSNGVNCILSAIDVESCEFITLDMDRAGIPVASVNVNVTWNAIQPYLNPPKFSVADLLALHVNARGTFVSNREDADTVFNVKDFTESYENTMKYMGV